MASGFFLIERNLEIIQHLLVVVVNKMKALMFLRVQSYFQHSLIDKKKNPEEFCLLVDI